MATSTPLRMRGWNQAINETSSTRKHMPGDLRVEANGDCYRYAYAVAACGVGLVAAGTPRDTDFHNISTPAAAIGDTTIVLTHTATGVAYPANAFANGTFSVNDGTGLGYTYRVKTSSAVTTTSTSVTLNLVDPIAVAIVASGTSEVTLTANRWGGPGVLPTTDEECFPAGVPVVAVGASEWAWFKTKGQMACYADNTGAIAAGSLVQLDGTVAGHVEIATTDSMLLFPSVGRAIWAEIDGDDAHPWCVVDLAIESLI